MSYDIIINLDYASYKYEDLQPLFQRLQHSMQVAGFVMDGRRFTIDLPPEQAQALARDVIDALDQQYQQQGQTVYPYIRECYGFEPEHVANLLLPPTGEIDVQELAGIEGVELIELLRKS